MFTRKTSNVKREIERKFSKSRQKLGKFWRIWGSGGQGFQKVAILLQKARPCVNPRRLSHFASKSVAGCDLQVGWGKNRESHRASHRKDMSPLTLGLNYRSACDKLPFRRRFQTGDYGCVFQTCDWDSDIYNFSSDSDIKTRLLTNGVNPNVFVSLGVTGGVNVI